MRRRIRRAVISWFRLFSAWISAWILCILNEKTWNWRTDDCALECAEESRETEAKEARLTWKRSRRVFLSERCSGRRLRKRLREIRRSSAKRRRCVGCKPMH